MASALHQESTAAKLLPTGAAGAVASFLTQPLQVMKTNKINTPTLVYSDLHKKIVENGWKSYMRGSYLAVVRQAYGFTLYTTMLRHYESHLSSIFPKINKYVNYSISAVSAKLVAMIFQAPITLLKTRIERISSASIIEEINTIMKNPMRDSLRGLGSSLVRQSIYTFFHYNTFRYLKDSILMEQYNTNSTFIPAFVAGIVAITVSQPFEVIRSQVSLNRLNESIFSFSLRYFRQHGARGYFYGFLPRLVRKPINSGICWTIYQALHHAE